MDLEVIAIDPDCFYSSEENDDDEEDSDDAEDNEVEPMSIQQTKVIERERQESGKGNFFVKAPENRKKIAILIRFFLLKTGF